MRTEVKIGIAVGAVLAVVVVGWIGIAAMKTKSPAPAAQNNAADNGAPESGINLVDLLPTTTSAPSEPAVLPVLGLPSESETKPAVIVSGAAPAEPADSSRLKIDWGDNAASTETKLGPTTEPTEAAAARTYVVKSGDSLWKIAEAMYGNGSKAGLIKDANKLESNALRVGQKLTIPSLPSKVSPAPSDVASGESANGGMVTGAPSAGQRIYTVTKEDTGLWAIARKVYGDGSKWDLIAKANHGINSKSLKVGQKLVIPALADGETGHPAESGKASTSAPARTAPAKSTHSKEPSNRPMFD